MLGCLLSPVTVCFHVSQREGGSFGEQGKIVGREGGGEERKKCFCLGFFSSHIMCTQDMAALFIHPSIYPSVIASFLFVRLVVCGNASAH
mmetsp:Transcript_53583/g.134851  ORF Transcript_53583/g.134851 Transcript_53583/m.134851 type:complete len:90 (+) Transcript_53583:1185-1454(+)